MEIGYGFLVRLISGVINRSRKWYKRNRIRYEQKGRDRIFLIRIDSKPTPTKVAQLYTPLSQSEDEAIERVYDDTEQITRYVIIMGDWNVVVGEGIEDKVMGEYWLVNRNERGEKLLEICNTLFTKHKKRKSTSKRQGDLRTQESFPLSHF